MTNYHEIYYDAAYVRARDALIPEALRRARKGRGDVCPFKDEKRREVWTASWNLAFHTAMNRLAAGLLK